MKKARLRMNFEIDREQRDLFERAAKADGRKLAQWARIMLTAAAKGQLCAAKRKAKR